jgi:LuxR family maltose regulon positive regulatory protein
MLAALITTKLNIPQVRSNLVTRPRLMEKLNGGLARRLTLVSAPPGFGKTTLIASWVESLRLQVEGNIDKPSTFNIQPVTVAWLSLDEGDNDPVRFFAYFVAAMQKIDPTLGQGIQSLLSTPPIPPLEALVAGLVNDLAGTSKVIILVLDDYYLIRNELVHKALQYFIEYQPSNVHLVLVTREDPPLPLPRLRARGEILEIREGDLRFSTEETAAFLGRSMGLNLSKEAITGLVDRTEGWIAGLQMAGLSLQQGGDADHFVASFQGDDRYVMDFLMEEVFHRQSSEIQQFLLNTSILDRLCASLCDAVLGDNPPAPYPLSPVPFSSSQETLEYLERSNLFLLPLDGKRAWYRYHHLFADLLRYRLQRQFPERLTEQHSRASRWYAQVGEPDEAMKHALAIPDRLLAADLAEQYLLHMIGGSRIATYLQWVQSISEELILSRPYLCVGCAWAYLLTGQGDAAGRYLIAGEAALPHYEPLYSTPDGRLITNEEVRGQLVAIRAYAARSQGDFLKAIELSNQALEYMPPTAFAVRCVLAFNLGLLYLENGEPARAREACLEAYEIAQKSEENLHIALSALSVLAGIATRAGMLSEAIGYGNRAIQLGSGGSARAMPNPAVGYAHGWLLEVHYQRNEMDAAQAHLKNALEMIEKLGSPETMIYAYLYQIMLVLARGDLSEAGSWVRRVEELIQAHPPGEAIRTEWIAVKGKYLLARGDSTAAARWLEALDVRAGDLLESPMSGRDQARQLQTRLPIYLLLGRVLLAQGAFDQATSLLERVSALAETGQNVAVLIEALVFQALAAHARRGEATQALSYLERALQEGAPEGYVRPFLNAGEALMPLLRRAIIQGDRSGYAQKLLAELVEQEHQLAGMPPLPSAQGGSPDYPGGLVEPLTDREKQVLRLLAAGLTSTDVAQELVISINTARSYIKVIYQKLGAHSREEAIDRARRYGLVKTPYLNPPH